MDLFQRFACSLFLFDLVAGSHGIVKDMYPVCARHAFDQCAGFGIVISFDLVPVKKILYPGCVPDKHKPVLVKNEVIDFPAAVADLDNVFLERAVAVFDAAAQGEGQADRLDTGVNGVANRGVDVILH